MTEKIQALSQSRLRWVILVLISAVIGTNYYVYDAMSSIKELMQIELGFSSTDYGLIVSFYAFPNTFLLMTVFGGILLDRFGVRKIGFLFTLLCALGALVTAYGATAYFNQGGVGYAFLGSFLGQYSPALKMMVLGRLLFGLGAETSLVAINKIMVRWFNGKEMAFAFGLNLAVARLGTAAALIFSPVLIESHAGWTTALWVAAILMGVGLLFFILYMITDKKIEQTMDLPPVAAEEAFHMRDIVRLLHNRPFIYITLLCVTFYAAVFPFQAYCPDFLHQKFNLSLKLSGMLSSVIIWGTILFTPIFGWYVDKKQSYARLMLGGSVLLFVSHLYLALTSFTPFVAMLMLGIAFSLVPAALWPAVAKLVEERRLGTAYGVMTSIQNLGMFLFPILAGKITDLKNPDATPEMLRQGLVSLDYTWTILMFAALGIAGFVFALLLKSVSHSLDGLRPAENNG